MGPQTCLGGWWSRGWQEGDALTRSPVWACPAFITWLLTRKGIWNHKKGSPSHICFHAIECWGNTWQFFLSHLPISLGCLDYVDNGKLRRSLLLVVGKECFRSLRCRVTPEVLSKLQKWLYVWKNHESKGFKVLMFLCQDFLMLCYSLMQTQNSTVF